MSGEVRLPHEIQVGRFLEARSAEVVSLASELFKSSKTGKLASQQVGRHMRRRAVSHNPKRLPRRLRSSHLSQRSKSDIPAKSSDTQGSCPKKTNSRRHRRRPANLLQEYNRRQAKQRWLETHIWHAKRFHMRTKWGNFRIPSHPTDKSWRACYRAANAGCLMRDMSFLQIIQVSAPSPDIIIQALNELTAPHQKIVEPRPGETELVLHKPGLFPQGVLGPVSLLWHSERRSVWLTLSPAFHDQLVSILVTRLSLKENPPPDLELEKTVNSASSHKSEEIDEPSCKKIKLGNACVNSNEKEKNVQLIKMQPKLKPFISYQSDTGVELVLLGSSLNRFRLTGPLTTSVLSHCLKPAELEPQGDSFSEAWWVKHFNDPLKKAEEEKRATEFRRWLKAVPQKSGSGVVSVVVRDPRLILPPKRNTAKLKLGNEERKESEIPDAWSLQDSALLCPSLRQRLLVERDSDHQINVLRSNNLVPGTPLSLGDREARLPVMLIERAAEWGAGLDLILPGGWATNFWICLVYAGARVGGEREDLHCLLERGSRFGEIMEDSEWGKAEAEERLLHMKEKHFRLPPDKRVNHTKLNVACPFSRPWGQLLREWAERDKPEENNFFIVRDALSLNKFLESGDTYDITVNNALVLVRLQIMGRGKIVEQSMIHIPNEDDNVVEELTEPLHEDAHEKMRKEARALHKQQKKRLKRQWKKVKDKKVQHFAHSVAQEKDVDESKMESMNTSLLNLKTLRDSENSNYSKLNEKLWSQEPSSIRKGCSRELVGWVVSGGYSYRKGCDIGEGLVTMRGLQILLQKFPKSSDINVLVREPTSLQYRKACLTVIC